jgi:uncharacterized heparinase superfamily protein
MSAAVDGRPVLADLPLLRRMPPIGPRPVRILHYVAFMKAQRVRRRVLRRNYSRRVAAARPVPEPAFAPLDLPPAGELPSALREAAERIRAEAADVRAHRVDYLGSGPVDLGPDIDWHRDFKSGYVWPSRFYMDVEVTRLDDDSDAKVPWELSRGHQLLTLARAARLFEDETCAAELERQLSSWIEANPPGHGINWVNAMEVGLRAVNWVWAVGTLEPWRPLAPRVRDAVAASLQAHGRHIAANLEGSPHVRSNHYLSDLLGLLAVGAALPGDRFARRWAGRAQRRLEHEILTQVHPDGVGFEASLPYHGLALEIFLLAHALAERMGTRFSDRYVERLRRMLEVSAAVRHPDGRTPLFGDNDSGRVLPEGFGRLPTHDNLLWLGAALLGGPRPLPGPPHPEVAWTLGLEAWRRADALEGEAKAPERAAFPEGGLYVLRRGGTQLVVRCGDLGQNGNGGHAHNDTLSFELSRSAAVIVDSGNYAYTFDIAARDELRSTRAHNTVMVDGQEINPIPARMPFRLAQVAHPRVERWTCDDDASVLVAGHDGYERLPGSVHHRRTFSLAHATGVATVTDEVEGSGEHAVESFLHLAAGASAEVSGRTASVRGPAADRLRIELEGTGGALELGEGWLSSSYGRRERGIVLIGRYRGALPVELRWVLHPEDARVP